MQCSCLRRNNIVYSFSLFLTNSFGTLLFLPVITSPAGPITFRYDPGPLPGRRRRISKYTAKIVGTQKRQVACVHGMQDQSSRLSTHLSQLNSEESFFTQGKLQSPKKIYTLTMKEEEEELKPLNISLLQHFKITKRLL